jgi:hypothetical protein
VLQQAAATGSAQIRPATHNTSNVRSVRMRQMQASKYLTIANNREARHTLAPQTLATFKQQACFAHHFPAVTLLLFANLSCSVHCRPHLAYVCCVP